MRAYANQSVAMSERQDVIHAVAEDQLVTALAFAELSERDQSSFASAPHLAVTPLKFSRRQ